MKITRLDLDGVGSPRKLAERIHEVERLPISVPIRELCEALDITSITETDTTSFEAALVTDYLRSSGDIIVSRQSPKLRQRFSIAHELGHFLIEAHRPHGDQPMQCALGDLHLVNPRDRDRRRRVEGQANTFASHLLMPQKRIREYLGRLGVSLDTLVAMALDFEVSKEAMVRAFVDAHREPVAVVLSRNGQTERFYKHEDFPFLPVASRKPLPLEAIALDSMAPGTFSDVEDVEADCWLGERDANRILALTEQVYWQSRGYALTLLQSELDEDE